MSTIKYIFASYRMNRLQYLLWQILLMLVLLASYLLIPTPLNWLFYVVVCLLTIWVTFQRLHDFDYSGWWWLLGNIPFVYLIGLIILCLVPGTKGPNRYGEDRAFNSASYFKLLATIVIIIVTTVLYAIYVTYYSANIKWQKFNGSGYQVTLPCKLEIKHQNYKGLVYQSMLCVAYSNDDRFSVVLTDLNFTTVDKATMGVIAKDLYPQILPYTNLDAYSTKQFVPLAFSPNMNIRVDQVLSDIKQQQDKTQIRRVKAEISLSDTQQPITAYLDGIVYLDNETKHLYTLSIIYLENTPESNQTVARVLNSFKLQHQPHP